MTAGNAKPRRMNLENICTLQNGELHYTNKANKETAADIDLGHS